MTKILNGWSSLMFPLSWRPLMRFRVATFFVGAAALWNVVLLLVIHLVSPHQYQRVIDELRSTLGSLRVMGILNFFILLAFWWLYISKNNARLSEIRAVVYGISLAAFVGQVIGLVAIQFGA